RWGRPVYADRGGRGAMPHRPGRRRPPGPPAPGAAGGRDDRDVVHRLAALELRGLGLRAPRTPPD
ncbi:MAG: hypothetical protein LH603_13215, partial [Pseudonocardia sp.]|nr:hypothetical protein [Pseudonocardia sp.]